MTTPQQAKTAVQKVLAEVPREHEAAYQVIYAAVRICVEAGMERKAAAGFLGISRWRIDKQGRYFRSLRATRELFRGAFSATSAQTAAGPVDEIVRRAWS
ncbi:MULTISPECIES: hypothetical protein [Paenarthrobacter]|uniref:Uncharacterized protein n=1 Tax=Paenarthrobacter ureafaciens TaxID=37931 RepID=A0AAX3ERS2_PAEUR|nr:MULTISPECIES: hypothetical protein [Paenarthrobacter]NKR10576.1 hypothetical protein [Arthrobacter sp. M5]NKR15188.1 hypothetical protein [Arthrobacter sp. M6]OEH61581.1 hypothetical protein A5N17_13830 [Arthrobacter sp. D2]OEH61640.1 hypothetical protein A5N13_16250 [Arthrobacter sp. D4]MDO5867016.1 hypothetical protein [Paenarthrobacter sp. SD-2]